METRKEHTTVSEQVLSFLDDKPKSKPLEISKSLGKTESHIKVILSRLKKERKVMRTFDGKYMLFPKFNFVDDKDVVKDKPIPSKQEISNIDIEAYKTLEGLRGKYDRETTILIVRKILKIIE